MDAISSTALSLLIWGGLQPIQQQLLYDSCTIVGWIGATTVLHVFALSVVRSQTSFTESKENSSNSNSVNKRSTNTDTRTDHRFHHYGMILSLLVSFGTIMGTSHGTFTNRWTMTIPMIPITVLHSGIYYYCTILSKRRQRPTQGPERTHSVLLSKILVWTLALVTLLFIFLAMGLSILFPAVELPPLISTASNNTNHQQYYPVGVIDFYIPLPPLKKETNVGPSKLTNNINNHNKGSEDDRTCSEVDDVPIIQKKYLPVRLLYPTHASKSSWWSTFRALGRKHVPYLNVETAMEFCIHSMKFAAPKPLKQMGWILHTWRLISLPVFRNAPLQLLRQQDDSSSGTIKSIPPKLVAFSHGLGGTMDLYSYQTMSLASAGYVVLSMTHTDGSAPIVPQPYPHQHLKHDTGILQLYEEGKHMEYELARQSQNAIRTHEYLYAVTYIQRLLVSISSDKDRIDVHENEQRHDFDAHRQTLQNHWQIANNETQYWDHDNHIPTYFMGHSFGGATAIQAAYERPDLVTAIIAHEPAMGWAAPLVCHSMFPSDILHQHQYHNFTTNFTVCPSLSNDEQIENTTTSTIKNEMKTCVHEVDMLVLNSHEWMNKKWSRAKLLQEMHRQQKLGKNPHVSRHGAIHQSHHNEFSDTSMLTPLWLARPVGLTGPRNPIHTAMEIAQQTLDFLQRVEAHY